MSSPSCPGIFGGEKKLKKLSQGSVLVTTRVPLPFLFLCFFFLILTVTFLPSCHSISVPSAFSSTGSSLASAMLYTFVSFSLLKNSFLANVNVSLNPTPSLSGSVSDSMLISDLRITSSFSVMLLDRHMQLCMARSQKSGTPLPSPFLPSAKSFFFPETTSARLPKTGAYLASYLRSSSRSSARKAFSSSSISSSYVPSSTTAFLTGSGRLLMNSSTGSPSSSSSSSSSSPSSSSASPSSGGGLLKLKLNCPGGAGAPEPPVLNEKAGAPPAPPAGNPKEPAAAGVSPFLAGVKEKGAAAPAPPDKSTPATPATTSSSSSSSAGFWAPPPLFLFFLPMSRREGSVGGT
mmetsp:Transcript_1360/g.3457  ORF Transcript_1360/g.3457 Transcript_1360/m.3457 type:complete len:348 (+) Transcript_1360:461-1504(+)